MTENSLQEQWNVMNKAVDKFKPERMVNLISSVMATIALLVCGIILSIRENFNLLLIAPIFSATGYLFVTTKRLFRMWDQVFEVLSMRKERNNEHE